MVGNRKSPCDESAEGQRLTFSGTCQGKDPGKIVVHIPWEISQLAWDRSAPTIATVLLCNANVLFAGLAPGWIGYYQASIQMPLAIVPPELDLSCGNSVERSQIP